MRTLFLLVTVLSAASAQVVGVGQGQAVQAAPQVALYPRYTLGLAVGYNPDSEITLFGVHANWGRFGGARRNMTIHTTANIYKVAGSASMSLDAGLGVELMTGASYSLYGVGGIAALVREVNSSFEFGADVFFVKGGLAFKPLFAEGELQMAEGGSAFLVRAGISFVLDP